MQLAQDISNWIKGRVKEANKKGIVIGLSGGIDSACVVALSKMAMGSNVLGLILPCHSNPIDEELALKVARQFNIDTKIVPLNDLFDALLNMFPEGSDIAKANLKPRLRMTVLYYFANSLDYLVAGTGNKSELRIGYFTKHGDGGVDFLPLGELLKTEVRKLAKELGVPKEIVDRPPSAGLWKDQTDESEMGMCYEDLDLCLKAIERKKEHIVKKEILDKVKSMIKNSRHKRKKPSVFNMG